MEKIEMRQVLITWKSGKEEVWNIPEGGDLTFGASSTQNNKGNSYTGPMCAQRFRLWDINVAVFGDEVPGIILIAKDVGGKRGPVSKKFCTNYADE